MDDKEAVMERIEKVVAVADPAVQVNALRTKLKQKKNLYEHDEPVDGVCRLMYRESGNLFVTDVGLNGAPTEEVLENMHVGAVEFYSRTKGYTIVEDRLLKGAEKKYTDAPIRVTSVDFKDKKGGGDE